jgi:hypothetical protein
MRHLFRVSAVVCALGITATVLPRQAEAADWRETCHTAMSIKGTVGRACIYTRSFYDEARNRSYYVLRTGGTSTLLWNVPKGHAKIWGLVYVPGVAAGIYAGFVSEGNTKPVGISSSPQIPATQTVKWTVTSDGTINGPWCIYLRPGWGDFESHGC